MSFKQLMESRKPKVNVKTVTSTKGIMEKLNIKNDNPLANRIVDETQKELVQHTLYSRHAAVVHFEDLELMNTLIVRVPMDEALTDCTSIGSTKYQFEVKDSITNYGTVSVYTTSFVAATRVIEKYISVAKHKSGLILKYTEKDKSLWKEGKLYE